MPVYTFQKAIIADKLHHELSQANIPGFQYVETVGDMVNIYCELDLEEADTQALATTVTAHDATPPPNISDVTPRQFRQALVLIGVSTQEIELALDSLPEPTKSLAKIEWEYSTIFQRHRPLVNQIGFALGWTSEQLDDLWTLAKSLT